jgi:hypothetical protein
MIMGNKKLSFLVDFKYSNIVVIHILFQGSSLVLKKIHEKMVINQCSLITTKYWFPLVEIL